MQITKKQKMFAVMLTLPFLIFLIWFFFAQTFIEANIDLPNDRKWNSISHTVLTNSTQKKYYVVHYNGVLLKEDGWTKEKIFQFFEKKLNEKNWVKTGEESFSGVFYFETIKLPNVSHIRLSKPNQSPRDRTQITVTVWESYASYDISLNTIKPSFGTFIGNQIED